MDEKYFYKGVDLPENKKGAEYLMILTCTFFKSSQFMKAPSCQKLPASEGHV